MLREKLTNTLSDYMSLPREEDRLCVSGKEIKSEDDGMERAALSDCMFLPIEGIFCKRLEN